MSLVIDSSLVRLVKITAFLGMLLLYEKQVVLIMKKGIHLLMQTVLMEKKVTVVYNLLILNCFYYSRERSYLQHIVDRLRILMLLAIGRH